MQELQGGPSAKSRAKPRSPKSLTSPSLERQPMLGEPHHLLIKTWGAISFFFPFFGQRYPSLLFCLRNASNKHLPSQSCFLMLQGQHYTTCHPHWVISDQPACGFITIPARAAAQRKRAKPCCLWCSQSSFHQHHHRQQEHCISYKHGAGLFAFLLLQVPCCAAADVTAACTATCRQSPASLAEITISGHRVAQAALHVASW